LLSKCSLFGSFTGLYQQPACHWLVRNDRGTLARDSDCKFLKLCVRVLAKVVKLTAVLLAAGLDRMPALN
jgi:hypothetical protein